MVMNRLGIITLVIALVSSSCAQYPTQPANLEQDIRQELNALGGAVVQRECDGDRSPACRRDGK
jgi:hypothetical protein